MKRLGTTGDNEFETDVPKTLERSDSGREATITNLNLPVKLKRSQTWNWIETGSKRQVATWQSLKSQWRQLRLSRPLNPGATRIQRPAARHGKAGRRPTAFKFDSDESERGEGEGAAAGGGSCPANRPNSYPPPSMQPTWRRHLPGPGSSSCPAAAKGLTDMQ